MQVNPINNTNNNLTTYRATIKPTKSLKEGFDMLERSADSIIMKDMNYAKDFIDSIARISNSNKIEEFKIDIDKRLPEHTYTKINGKRVFGGHNDRMNNLQDGYLVVEGTKKYASNLEEVGPSTLDLLKAQVEDAQRTLDELKVRYSDRLKAEFEQARKIIFNNVK